MKIKNVFVLLGLGLALAGCGSEDAPDNQPGSVTLSGTPEAGATLTAMVEDPDGVDPANISYQWLAGDVPLATGQTFTLTDAQRGLLVRVTATWVDNAGFSESGSSAPTTEVLSNQPGTVTIDGTTTVESTLTATPADPNGLPDTLTYAWSADGVVIDGQTEPTIVLTDAVEGAVISVTVTYTDLEGFAETAVSENTEAITPLSTNTAAEFAGLSANTSNDVAVAVTGSITVTDADTDESLLVAQTGITTTFGTFSVNAAGAWSYILDNANATIAALVDANDSVDDTIMVESVDGTMASLVISISGVNPPALTNQAAVIRDLTDDDTGELRYSLPEALAAGRLEVSFSRTDDDVGSVDAFISIFNSGNNSGGNLLDLRVRDNSFETRSPKVDIDPNVAAVVPDTIHDVVITWEYPNGNTAEGSMPTITIEVDGVEALPAYVVAGSNPVGGAATISFRIGGQSNVSPPEAQFIINEFAVYSDTAGTTLVFEDDFSGFTADDSLDGELNDASPYSNNTEDATVEVFDDGTSGPGNSGNKYARIIDTTDDTGELRFMLPEALAAGRLEVSYNRTDDDVGSADGFISLFNSNTNNAGSILDLRVRDNSYETRYPKVNLDTSLAAVVPGTFHNLVVTWSYPDGNTAAGVLPTVTIMIDGVEAVAPFTPVGSNPEGGVAAVSFRFGTNSATTPVDAQIWIDNFKVFSDVAGTNLVHSDDFEAYADGEDLDPDNNAASVYAGASVEVIVASEM